MSLSLYFHTLKYLKVEQLFFQIYYKVCAKVRSILSYKPDYTRYKQGFPVKFIDFPDKYASYHGNDTFCFLNLSHRFVELWDDCSLGNLWRYNLNYMDFLLQSSMDVQEGIEWIERFIDGINDNRIAADPYPISLRGINWIKFVSLHHEKLTLEQLKKIDTALYSQYFILSHRTERHLLANHYLENGFSLLSAAVYFHDEVFWRKAQRIVTTQLEEQILADGAHYELSPMYHCVILERLLDCYNLLFSAEDNLFEGIEAMKTLLRDKAVLMLAWMEAMVVADDTIPLLNDSANGVALTPRMLREYARRLQIKWDKGILGASGYRHIVQSSYEVIIDMAPLGVSYNLGHAHADTSTFLLWTKSKALFVDTGTSTYNAGERRNYERSTRAHNVVVVDGENSSKVWGAFRCAQRANVRMGNDVPMSYEIMHDGYKDKGVICSRQFLCREDRIEIIDIITTCKQCDAIAYFYLSSDVRIKEIYVDSVVTDCAVIHFKGGVKMEIIEVEIAEEYNKLKRSHCIQVTFDSSLHTIIDNFK